MCRIRVWNGMMCGSAPSPRRCYSILESSESGCIWVEAVSAPLAAQPAPWSSFLPGFTTPPSLSSLAPSSLTSTLNTTAPAPSKATGTSLRHRFSPESNRQVSRAVNVQCSSRLPGLVAGQLDVVEPMEEIAQGDFRLHPGKRRTQAEVDSVAESDVRIGIARNAKFFAALELCFISIGRADHRPH